MLIPAAAFVDENTLSCHIWKVNIFLLVLFIASAPRDIKTNSAEC